MVFFESPKRIGATLELLKLHMKDRKIFIGREMTKSFESFYYFSLDNIPDIPYLGEFVVLVAPATDDKILDVDLKTIIEKFSHIKTKDLVELIAAITTHSKKKIYTEILNLNKK